LASTGVFNLIQSQNELLLVMAKKEVPVDLYQSSYTGGLIKTDLKKILKLQQTPCLWVIATSS
jgi:hypothetical protein